MGICGYCKYCTYSEKEGAMIFFLHGSYFVSDDREKYWVV
jgi:hypothetical protein